MSLATEDQLRLNVLLANDVEAIRIDERTLTVYGLAGDQEAKVTLNPNCRPEQYLRRVRELLSSHVLGSPGGYPLFLQRWTRMGQTKDAQLGKLLLLGEPEAVIAVAGAPGLTDDIARRAWWTDPTADNARRMLARAAVVQGVMGKILAAFLVEHLPFETDPLTIVTTVRLILQAGLVDADTRRRIWVRGTHRNAYRLGFLQASPDAFPEPVSARADYARYCDSLAALASQGNPVAALAARVLDGPGQTFLATAESLLQHPVNHDTAAALLNTLGEYFHAARVSTVNDDGVEIVPEADGSTRALPPAAATVVTALPALAREVDSLLALAQASESLIIDILAKTSASGTLLRRKLDPAIAPLLAQIAVLRGLDAEATSPRRLRSRGET